jgi:hypothetical protein
MPATRYDVLPRPSAASNGRRLHGDVALGVPEGAGVGPQSDLVDHHRRHGDGVPAGPSPLGVELFRRLGDLLELDLEQAAVLIDPGQ